MISSFLIRKTMEPRRQQNYILKILKEKDFQARVLYPIKLHFRNERIWIN